MTLSISGNTPFSYVARLEEIVKDVRAGKVKAEQLEGLIRPLQLSNREIDAFWGPGNEGLRNREAAAYAAIAEVMPNAPVFTYGNEQAALIEAGLLLPALTASYFAAATPFNNALAAGDVETAIQAALVLVRDHGHTPASKAACELACGEHRSSTAKRCQRRHRYSQHVARTTASHSGALNQELSQQPKRMI